MENSQHQTCSIIYLDLTETRNSWNKYIVPINSSSVNLWRAVEGTAQFKNMTSLALALEAAMQLCDSFWTWGHGLPVAALDREWGAAGFNPWVSGASEVASQHCPRRDVGDRFTGVFSRSSEPSSKDSQLAARRKREHSSHLRFTEL